MSFKLPSLAVAMATISISSIAGAAGLDRSTQPSWAFTQDGTFAYVEHITINPSIEGKDSAAAKPTPHNYTPGHDIADMAEDYQFTNYGAKADINDTVSVGVFFDQPWGADVQYSGNNNFVNGTISAEQLQQVAKNAKDAQELALTDGAKYKTSPTDKALAAAYEQSVKNAKLAGAAYNLAQYVANNPNEGTSVSVSSQNFTGLIGVKLGEQKNLLVYGGPVLQKLEGDVHLRGKAYSATQGYDATFTETTGYGWMAGIAYSKPEIALKAALTYRSEIDHDTHGAEYLPARQQSATNKITITTPQSVNLDFQTGLNPTTLLNAKIRWVPWSDFAIKPQSYSDATKLVTDDKGQPLYPNGLNLVDYSDDAWTAEVGIGKKLSDRWAVTGNVGWDSGAGNPTTTLGPVEGYWSLGLGAKYNITPEWSVSAGAKYLMFGDAKTKIPNNDVVGEFTDNHATVYGVRLSYQKK